MNETISKELAEEIKKKIWQSYLDTELGVDYALPFKMAVDVVFSFVKENKEDEL